MEKKTPQPRYTTRITLAKMAYYFFIFRRFWVKEPRQLENEIAKKEYTFILASVGTAVVVCVPEQYDRLVGASCLVHARL